MSAVLGPDDEIQPPPPQGIAALSAIPMVSSLAEMVSRNREHQRENGDMAEATGNRLRTGFGGLNLVAAYGRRNQCAEITCADPDCGDVCMDYGEDGDPSTATPGDEGNLENEAGSDDGSEYGDAFEESASDAESAVRSSMVTDLDPDFEESEVEATPRSPRLKLPPLVAAYTAPPPPPPCPTVPRVTSLPPVT